MFKYCLYRFAQFLVRWLPLDLAYRLGVCISDLQYIFSFRDRRAVRNNLKRILSNTDHLSAMTREVFRNFGRYLVEFLKMDKMVDQDFMAHKVTVDGIEHLGQALQGRKGVILVTAHIGNWEIGAVLLSKLGYALMIIALPHKERPVNDLFNHQREVHGITVVSTNNAIRKCMEHLKNNKIIAIAADRDFTVKGGELTDFLGAKAMIPRGAAIFSHKTGAPILPTFLIRQEDKTFRLSILEPLPELIQREDISEEEAVRDIMRQYLRVIEQEIRRYPTQWLLFREFVVPFISPEAQGTVNTQKNNLCPKSAS